MEENVTLKQSVALTNVAHELLAKNTLRLVSAWVAMRTTEVLECEDSDAPYELYMTVSDDVGEEKSLMRSHLQEELHGLPSSYHHYVQLARQYGARDWPLLALTAFLRAQYGEDEDEDDEDAYKFTQYPEGTAEKAATNIWKAAVRSYHDDHVERQMGQRLEDLKSILKQQLDDAHAKMERRLAIASEVAGVSI